MLGILKSNSRDQAKMLRHFRKMPNLREMQNQLCCHCVDFAETLPFADDAAARTHPKISQI